MWKYEITTIDGCHSLKHIKLKDLKFTIRHIKLDKRFIDQKLMRPRAALLIQHLFLESYNLDEISSITLNTSRR
ncbi:MAG: hypothetical protein DRO67_06060 [Candidatus Asgardarchaeum californiense]|nr:MAG: hypothetical protein DRO67_06060 [Candidatus Asgardarchaeum californiense]